MCLHGFPESGASWSRQLLSLGAMHQILAPDGRGHGRSGCPRPESAYRIGKLVADVLAVADQFHAERFALVGHDWGGVVAWCAAAWHPDRISHLVTINAPHPSLLQAALDEDPDQQEASSYIAGLTAPDTVENLTAERLWELIFAADEARGLIGPDEKAELLASWNRPDAIEAMLNWYRAAPFDFQPVGGQGAGRLDEPLRITVPTLVLWGLDDAILLPSLLAGLDQLVPELELRTVERAGHGILRERPDLVTRAIADHVSSRAR
jgi:pimeloyl-ACP methyl ester carboxylesterase